MMLEYGLPCLSTPPRPSQRLQLTEHLREDALLTSPTLLFPRMSSRALADGAGGDGMGWDSEATCEKCLQNEEITTSLHCLCRHRRRINNGPQMRRLCSLENSLSEALSQLSKLAARLFMLLAVLLKVAARPFMLAASRLKIRACRILRGSWWVKLWHQRGPAGKREQSSHHGRTKGMDCPAMILR